MLFFFLSICIAIKFENIFVSYTRLSSCWTRHVSCKTQEREKRFSERITIRSSCRKMQIFRMLLFSQKERITFTMTAWFCVSFQGHCSKNTFSIRWPSFRPLFELLFNIILPSFQHSSYSFHISFEHLASIFQTSFEHHWNIFQTSFGHF